jgi:glycosyltransferase involved in cell wall biosynthesis
MSSAHQPLDDRLYHHLAKTFQKAGHHVTIICSTGILQSKEGGITWDSFEGNFMNSLSKIAAFRERLSIHNPDIIISQEPLPTLAAFLHKRKSARRVKIVYDITEWQPSQTQLRKYKHGMNRMWQAARLACFSLFAAMLADAFIFGELAKRFPYRYLFPFKKSTIVGYYPEKELFENHKPPGQNTKNEWVLGYTGILNEERGIFRFLEAVQQFQEKWPSVKIRLLVVGWFENVHFQQQFEQKIAKLNEVILMFYPQLPLLEFCRKVAEMDICFDLRKTNWENNHSLPIKLFYYMAAGKPMIYSRLKAIENEVSEIKECAQLVNPKNTSEIVEAIERYILHSEEYMRHGQNARALFETRYNWNLVSIHLLRFVESIGHAK